MTHLERYAQIVWPELDVHLTSVTDQWAGAAVAGPRSRDLLAVACGGADVSNAALPFMGCIETTVAGAPVRIIRMDVFGRDGLRGALPGRLRRARVGGAARGGRAVRRHALRHRSAQRAAHREGACGPQRAGRAGPSRRISASIEWRRDEDFIGRRSLERFRNGGRKRKTFVGLVSENGRAVPRGGHLVWNPTAPRPMPMLGHVTSNCYSPHAATVHRAGADGRRRGLEGQDALCRVTAHVELRPGPNHRSRVHRSREPATEGMIGNGGMSNEASPRRWPLTPHGQPESEPVDPRLTERGHSPDLVAKEVT